MALTLNRGPTLALTVALSIAPSLALTLAPDPGRYRRHMESCWPHGEPPKGPLTLTLLVTLPATIGLPLTVTFTRHYPNLDSNPSPGPNPNSHPNPNLVLTLTLTLSLTLTLTLTLSLSVTLTATRTPILAQTLIITVTLPSF